MALDVQTFETRARDAGVVISSVPWPMAPARLRWRGRDSAFIVVLVALDAAAAGDRFVPLVYVMWASFTGSASTSSARSGR